MGSIDVQRLVRATNGALAIDRDVVRGWRLYDLHPYEERSSIRFELTDDADRMVEIEVLPQNDRLVVKWLPSSADAQAASAAQASLDEILQRIPADIWRSSDGEGAIDNARVIVRDAGSWSDLLLSQDFDSYCFLFGVRPRRVRVSANACEAAGDSAFYPEAVRGLPFAVAALYPYPRRFRERRRFREYLARLGFALDAHGIARTVPLPETFRTAVNALTGHEPAWMPRLEPVDFHRLGHRAWAECVAGGVLPTMVPATALVAPLRWLPAALSRDISFAPGMLAHDMSLHAFAFHRVRPEAMEPFVASALVRRSSWRTRRRLLSRMAYWFERSLTRAAWDVWRQVDRPEAFDALFAEKGPSLARAFDERVLAGA